jgi:anaerobic selenocysteine-containing dehydrogenase
MTRRSFVKAAAVVGAATALSATITNSALGVDPVATSAQGADVKVVRTACRGCGKMECGVLVTVQNGRAIKVEGDQTAFQSDGNCCTKSQASLQACYHPDRLKFPMKRTNPKDAVDPGWQRITWEEAFSIAAEKIKEIKEKYGGPSMYSMVGTSRVWSMGGLMAWPQVLETPNTIQAYQVCKGPRHFATRMTSNRAFSWMETVARPRVYVQWGGASEISNYDDSCRTTVDAATVADTHIVVDPRMAGIGRNADYWMHLRPGTDAALALSWVNVILENNLIDELFVKKWSNGPFLVLEDKPASGWTEFYGPGRPWELATKLLKESDIVEGGSPKRFMVWDTLAEKLTYFDAATGLWEGEPEWVPPTKGKEAQQPNLVEGFSQGFVIDPTPFNPVIDPALYGEFSVTLKDGSTSKVRPVLDHYREYSREFVPAKAAEITGIPAAQIEAAAKAYATRLDPESGYGNGGIQYMLAVEHSANAIQNCRAIDTIAALTGNYDTPGGHRGPTMAPVDGGFTPFAFMVPGAMTFPDSSKEIGDDEFPLNRWWGGWSDANTAYDAMEKGEPYPLVGGVNMSGDFMNMANANFAWERLQKLDFILECNLWHAPSSDVADLLLPAWHWLEVNCSRVSQGSSGAFGANIRCVEPPAETLWDPLIIMGVCKAMGIPYSPNPEDPWPGDLPTNPWPGEQFILDNAVRGSGKSWDEYAAEFVEKGWWDAKIEEPDRWGTYRRYETGYIIGGSNGFGGYTPPTPGWNTPTKKYEIWSTIAEAHYPQGEYNLPTFKEPPHSPVSDPERFKDYPFVITTGRRIPVYFHSEHRQLPWCRELWPVPRVEINPEDAAEQDIKQGDWVWIETEWGKIRQVADLYYGIQKGTINCEHQWWYPELNESGHGFALSGVNVLNDRYAQCPLCGATNLRAYLAKIYKATPENCPGGKVVPCGLDGTEIIHDSSDPRLKEWLPDYEGRD